MTYYQFCRKHGICSHKIIYFAGYRSTGIHNFHKGKPYEQLPFGMRRAIKLMAANMHYIYHNQQSDDPDWFVQKMHSSNIRIFSKDLYQSFTFRTLNTFRYKIERSEALCKSVCLFVWTGIYLYIGGYEEGSTSSQQDLNTLPPDTSATLPV